MFSNELVCDILSYLEENINEPITIDELCHTFCFDKSYIMKLFKKEIGLPIHSYINHIRIFNSLQDFDGKTTFLKIAFHNGFQSLEYFSEVFKKVMLVTPTTYKKFVFVPSHLSEGNIS